MVTCIIFTSVGLAFASYPNDTPSLTFLPLPVYTLDNYIYQYDFSSGLAVTLAQFYNEYVFNPSVSPDGAYIVFERQSTGTPIQYDLWIMNRNNPAEMWPLTNDGRSSDPDWSRQEPQTSYRSYLPVVVRRQ